MVLTALTTYPEILASGVDIGGVANVETFLLSLFLPGPVARGQNHLFVVRNLGNCEVAHGAVAYAPCYTLVLVDVFGSMFSEQRSGRPQLSFGALCSLLGRCRVLDVWGCVRNCSICGRAQFRVYGNSGWPLSPGSSFGVRHPVGGTPSRLELEGI